MKAYERLPGPAMASSTSTPVGLLTTSESVFIATACESGQEFSARRFAVDPQRRRIPVLRNHALVVDAEHVEPGGGIDMVRILGIAHFADGTDHDKRPVGDDVDDMHLHARLDGQWRPFLAEQRHERRAAR